MTKENFKNLLDELTDGTGFDLDKVQKEFAYKAAIKYHESRVKKLNIPDVVGRSEQLCYIKGCKNKGTTWVNEVTLLCDKHNQ